MKYTFISLFILLFTYLISYNFGFGKYKKLLNELRLKKLLEFEIWQYFPHLAVYGECVYICIVLPLIPYFYNNIGIFPIAISIIVYFAIHSVKSFVLAKYMTTLERIKNSFEKM